MTAHRHTIFIKCLFQRFPVISKWFQMISKYLKHGFSKNSKGSQNTPKAPNHSHHLSSNCIPHHSASAGVFSHKNGFVCQCLSHVFHERSEHVSVLTQHLLNQGFQFSENRLAIVLKIAHPEVFILEILRARTQKLLQCELAILQREQKRCMWWPRKIGAGLPTWPFVSACFAAKMAYVYMTDFKTTSIWNPQNPRSRIQGVSFCFFYVLFIDFNSLGGISKSTIET